MIKDVAAYVWNITPFLLPSPQSGSGAGGEGFLASVNTNGTPCTPTIIIHDSIVIRVN
ncbi:hypothetical protein [Coleofasciculus sp. E1-EBD-02]|uniref:hypothetical protein n=1 Tax=Coleofasciculus sp. E1-EBD-02 TaxID=3068481 RepID=UPI0032F263FF